MATNHPLLDIAHKCGVKEYVLKDIYRRMLDKSLFLIAYGNLYANKGALTPGTDDSQSMDGMSEERIDKLIESLRNGTFRWTPVRRVYIPKKRGGTRPLGIPNLNDKLVQEVMRMILESYYEPQFKDSSHGYRPKRSCHTALKDIVDKWRGVVWFVEGDIKGCFDNINHDYLLEQLEERVKDTKFLKLMRQMLEAGYLEEWKRYKTFSGTPQGGIISPLLSNLVLHGLDRYVEDELIPQFNQGKRRRYNLAYWRQRRMYQYHRKRGNHAKAKERKRRMQELPSGDQRDPNFRRLLYVRYADDFLIGVIGTKKEADEIKEKVGRKLAEMGLAMSEEKTFITHARTQTARFLGFEVGISSDNIRKISAVTNGRRHKRRSGQAVPRLYVPREVVTEWTRKYSKNGKPVRLTARLEMSDLEIINQYGSEVRGLANYYMPASDVSKAIGKVTWVALESAVKTLAFKYKKKTGVIWQEYWREVHTGKKALYAEVPKPNKPGEVYKAMCGEVSFEAGTFHENIYDRVWTSSYDSNELVKRLTAQRCELCGRAEQCEVHHFNKLRNVQKKWAGRKDKPDWVKFMIQRRRKTVVVCKECHNKIHGGIYDGPKVSSL